MVDNYVYRYRYMSISGRWEFNSLLYRLVGMCWRVDCTWSAFRCLELHGWPTESMDVWRMGGPLLIPGQFSWLRRPCRPVTRKDTPGDIIMSTEMRTHHVEQSHVTSVGSKHEWIYNFTLLYKPEHCKYLFVFPLYLCTHLVSIYLCKYSSLT